MKTDRGPLPLILALLGLFLGSAVIGVALARTFAPGSFLADIVSFFALPVAFAFGLKAWFGLALAGAAIRVIGMRRTHAVQGSTPRAATTPLPGSFVFLPLSSGAGAAAGIVVAIVSTRGSGWLAWLTYWIVGTLHGLVAWRLARAGVLMPPESV
jgi:hypothetical protein